MKSSKLHPTQVFASTGCKTKQPPNRYQCIRQQEKSTDTQALAVKGQKLIDTICHEIKHKSTEGYSSPGNKTKQSTDRQTLAAHKQKSTEAGKRSLLAYALKMGTKQNSGRADLIREQKKSINRRIWARKETQIYREIYFSRGKKSVGRYILAGNKTKFSARRIQQGTKEDSLLKDLSGSLRKSTDTHCSREQTNQSGERMQNGKTQEFTCSHTLAGTKGAHNFEVHLMIILDDPV